MKTAWKLMAFSILLNIAISILGVAFPIFDPSEGHTFGLSQDKYGAIDDFRGVEGNVTPNGQLQQDSSLIDRVLDVTIVGWIQRIAGVVQTYLYGWVNLLQDIFGGLLGEPLSGQVFTLLKGALTLAYIIALVVIWTGRDFDS